MKFLSTRLHGITSQKSAFFLVSTFGTSYLACRMWQLGCIQITAWSRVLFEKLAVPQVVSNISWFLWNLKLHYHVHKLLPLFSVLSHMNLSHTFSSCFYNMRSVITLSVSRSWSLTLREECWLRVFENCVLRRIFGPKRLGNKWVEKTT
jgi:hypothetical protein